MHNNRSRISPDIEGNEMSRPSTPSQHTSNQSHSYDLPNIMAIVSKDIGEQHKPRRRSLDNMADNAIARDERNKEEIVRESLRQVIMKYMDWDSYLTYDSDYIAFIANWSCHWWCWRLCCSDHKERHFLQSLDGDFLCPLHYAVIHNNLPVCESLLRDERYDVNVNGINRETVLHMYARRHKWSTPDKVDPGEQILRLFVDFKSKIKIDALDSGFQTPLHHAVKRNNYSYAKWLIEHGADVTKLSRFHETPLHLACSLSLDSDSVRMIEILLSAMDPILKKTMLFSNTVILNRLQRRYANIQDADGKTALCRAAEKNHVETVKLLLSHVNNDQWETTLVSAVKSGNCTILNNILVACSRYSSLNVPILHLACKLNNGRQVVRRSLMTDESSPSMDKDYITAFLVENLHLNILSDYNKESYTPVLLATHFGFVDCVKYLLSTSQNVEHQLEECTKDNQRNILHVCAEQGHKDSTENSSSVQFLYDPDEKTVEMTFSKPKTIKSTDSTYFTICQFVLEDHKCKHIADRLLYQQDYKGNIPLHLVCQQSNLALCELFVKHMKENTYLFVEDLKQRTPLHACAKFGNRDLVKILLPDTIDRKIALKALNDSRDMDGKTPLHLACTEGNMEVIQCFVKEFNASLTTQAENRDTLIVSACEHGHLKVVNYLLKSTNTDATIRNSKGLNALDVAIVNHRENIVRLLLTSNNWRRLMENAYYDDNGTVSTPMRELIIFMPEIAYEVIDTKLTMINGSDDMIAHQVTYDYTFFEDQYRIRSWMYGEDKKKKSGETNWFSQMSRAKDETTANQIYDPYTSNAYTLVRNHPLLIAAKCEQMKLMEHEYCTRLGMEKFRRFGLGLFSIFFIIFALFVALYTALVLESKHPFFYYNLYNESLNGTSMSNFGLDTSLCEAVGAFLIETKNPAFLKSSAASWFTPFLQALVFTFIAKNILILVFSFPRIFRNMAVYFESLAIILCFLNVYDWYSWQIPLNLRCPDQWQLGAIGLLFSWITILTYMQYISLMNIGLYVVMIQVIFWKFVKCLPVLLTLICGFGFTYYMLLQYQTVYETPYEALMRTAISLYDLGYEARLYTPSDGGIMLYPVIYFVFILTEIALTIIVANLLIGLAVGEIPTLKTQAAVNRNIIFYELLFDYEFLHMQLKGFARYLLRRIRYGEFPFCCFRCRCPTQCNTLAECICCDCAVHTWDYMSNSRHRRDRFFLSRWMDNIEGWLIEKEIHSAIGYQKEWKKKNMSIGSGPDD